MKKRNNWKDFFYFTRSERYGSWILGLLLVLSFLLPRLGFFSPAPRADFSKLERAWALWESQRHLPKGKEGDQEKEVVVSRREGDGRSVELFSFDPNTVSREDLLRLGFSDGLARTLMNFRGSGARFRRAEDLLKVYGMRPAFLERLRPYVQIAEDREPDFSAIHLREKKADSKRAHRSDEELIQPLDINLASPADWDALPGIGPYYAGRILRFRDALGGFWAVEQVAETYGLPDSVFQKIKPYLRRESPVKPLAVNEASVEALSRHPYLTRRQAEILVAYRKRYGPFAEVEDLLHTGVVAEEDLERLAPYLSFKKP